MQVDAGVMRRSRMRWRRAVVAAVGLVVAVAVGVVFPALGSAASWAEGPSGEGLSPLELHAAYQLPFETPSAYQGMPSGSEPIVALIDVGADPTLEENLGVYSEAFGLPACTESNGCLRVINKDGNPQPLPTGQQRAGETDLDVEVAHAICAACHILVVEGPDSPDDTTLLRTTGEEVNAAVAAGASAISISIELFPGPSEDGEDLYLREIEHDYFTHPGVVITAAAGDCGYNMEAALDGLPNEIGCEAGGPYYPGAPAKLERVIAVGGTKLSEVDGAWKSKAWFDGVSGCAFRVPTPPWQAALPEWPEAGCAGGRAVADVSADASCQTGPETYDAQDKPQYEWGLSCGTSAASPLVAAEFALAGGARGREKPARTLYEHAGDADAFYDVTEGLNGTGCQNRIECHAWPGWDEPTGLGSPIGLAAFALPGAPENESLPRISGGAWVGGTLDLEGGEWRENPLTTFDEWQECDARGQGCRPIMGATASTYTLTEADLGKTIRVVETAGNASGYSPPATSAPTAVVTAAPASPPATPSGGTSGTSPSASAPTPPAGRPPRPERALLSILHRTLRLLPGGVVTVGLRCRAGAAAGCRGAVAIRAARPLDQRAPRLLGRAGYRVRAGQALRLRVRLAGFVRPLLERERRLPVVVSLGTRGGGGASRHVDLRLPARG